MNRKFAFIGLGNMGSGMARHLLSHCLRNNIELSVFDIKAQPVSELVKLGANAAASVIAAVNQAELVFTSLPSAREIHQVAIEQGLLKYLSSEAFWFETSTNDLAEWEKIKQQADTQANLIDAPVTGGAEGAAAGTLTMLVGAEASQLKDYLPVLQSFCKKTVFLGSSGSGYVAKLVQLHLNYLVALGMGEAMMLAAKAGLDLNALYPALQNSCAQSYVVDAYMPKVLDGSYDPSFSLALAYKDMRLIANLAQHLQVPMALGDVVSENYQSAVETYGGEQPHLNVVRLLEDNMGVLLR